MNTKAISRNVVNGFMNVFTAAMIDPSAAQNEEEAQKMQASMMRLLTEATNNFEAALQEALKAPHIIVSHDSMTFKT